MSFKPDLNSLHECINFSSTVRDNSSSFPFSPRSTYADSFRVHSSKVRNSHDESYLRNLIKPSTAKGGSRTPMKLRETPRVGQQLRKRVDFSVLDEGLSFRTNNHCHSQRSDMTEPEDKDKGKQSFYNTFSHPTAEERSPSPKITANVVHRINGRGEITRMSVPHSKSRIRTGSTQPKSNITSQWDQEKPVVQDPLIEKFQSNYQRLRKNIVKLTAKQSERIVDDTQNETTTGFITKITPSSPIKYEGARHSLIIKSEDPKISDTEKTLPTDASSSPRKRFNYRKPSINTRSDVETIPTLTSPKTFNLHGVKPFKVYLLSEDVSPNAKAPNRPQSVQRTVKKMAPYDSPDRNNDTIGDEMPAASSRGFEDPRRIAAMFPKDTEYCRMRSIRNYIIQKKNLHFYSFTPKEYLNYKAIASMISQGNANITVIPQEQFASSFYGGTPKTDTSTKWFTKELESDLLTRSLVLGPPEKKKPVLVSTRPGTSQDRQDRLKKMRNNEQKAQSSSPMKEKSRYASTGRTKEKAKKGFLVSREIDNFELEGWDQKTEESQ